MALLSIRADKFWKKTGKKISIQGTDMAGRRRDNYRQDSKVEEHAPKALMTIDGVGWDWSFMENEEEDHALVADEETPIEFSLMAKTSADSEVFDNSLCSKTCLSLVESRLVEFKNQKVKYYKKIRGLEFKVEARANRIECLTNELELLKKEKEGLESKPIGFQSASKDLDSLLESQRSNKNKEGPLPVIESTSYDVQNRNPFVTETEASPSTISSKPFIKFVKGNSQNHIDDKGYWDSGCSQNITGNISYLSDYEPFDGGYVSFVCIVLGRDFKLIDDTNVLLRTPRQHNMYSINLNNIVPHKDLTCLVAKASTDECMLWHRRLDVRSSNTPMDKENPWGKDRIRKDVDLHLYRSMIGSLMYLTASRLDIMFTICTCARHQVTPKECHLHAVKRIFRYLKDYPKLGLWYLKESPFDLVAYSDSYYGGATQDRKSTTGGCQFFGRRLILWQCKKQTIVATSTTKAEYVAAASCYGQVLWILNLLLDYGYNFMITKIYIENNSTICIVKNPVYHSKTKHIEIRHHFIRDCFEKKLISVDYIHTDENVADLLTKPFDAGRF
nr:putative ribonuclease H-like domain-containing protein [Tanacetum cinerariifolium]